MANVLVLGMLAAVAVLGASACGGSAPASSPNDMAPVADGGAVATGATDTAPKWETPRQGGHRTDIYDKEPTEIALRRAALQVKNNCGQAKDENGKAMGPWGNTQVSVTLGHNGHVKGVTIPAPFDGQITGKCALQAFGILSFPPWDGADTTLSWDVQIPEPTTK